MEFHRVIETRRSLRAFSARPVEAEKIERILEAARWAPSCANRQPWIFVVVGIGDPSRAQLEESLDPGNAWAGRAPVLIVAASRKDDGAVVESREYHRLDTGMAIASLLFRAVDQGLVAHPMAGWREAALRAALSLPEDVSPIAVVAVGYAGKPEDLDEAARRKDDRPRSRKPLREIAFQGRWGVPYAGTLPSGPAKVYEADVPLRFGDTDAMGHVNNATIISYLEIGRLRFFADVVGARKVEDVDIILGEISCRYRLPILFHDRVRMRMHITDVSRSSFRFRCQLFDPGDGRLFAEAETVQVMYDYSEGRPRAVDELFLSKVRDYIGG